MIFCPLFFWVGSDLRVSQEAFYQTAGTALICSMMFFNIKSIRKNKLNIWLGIFAVYTIVLFLLGGANLGATIMMNVFVGTMLYFFILGVKKEDTHILLKTIIMVGVINIIYIALQMLNFDFIFNIRGPGDTILWNTIDPIGFFGLKAPMGMFMALSAIATLLVNPILSIAFLAPLWMSRCTGAFMGVIAGVLFYFFWIRRKIFWIMLPILLITGSLYVIFVDSPMGMMGNRLPLWKMALKDTVFGYNLREPKLQSPYLRNPFTGFGLDAFRNGPIMYFKICDTETTIRGIRIGDKVYDPQGRPFTIDGQSHVTTPDGKKTDIWAETHNSFVQLFYEMGLIGVVIFGFILFYIKERFKNAFKSKELVTVTSLIICLLFCMLTQFPERLSRIGFLIPILLGLFTVNTDE